MTVAELIERLQEMPQDAGVIIETKDWYCEPDPQYSEEDNQCIINSIYY